MGEFIGNFSIVINMIIQPTMGIRGWLNTSGACYFIRDTHTDFSARHLNIKLPPLGTPDFLRAGLNVDKMMYNRGWVRIIIRSEIRTLYFDTLNVPWNQLSRHQRGWLYDIAMRGVKIVGDKIIHGDTILNIPLTIVFGDTNKNVMPDELIAESMSFFGMLKEMLNERLSFKDLYNASDPARKDRAAHVRPRPLKVTTMNKKETWTFRYKSYPSTTGNPWHGYIQFHKDTAMEAKSAGELDCIIECDCPDYKYKCAYANTQQDASRIGRTSWSQCKNRPPHKTNPDQKVGLCKHLLSLGDYLKTKLDPSAPEPGVDEYDPYRVKPKIQKKEPATFPGATVQAPEPDDSYSDSRTGSDTMQEDIEGNNRSVLYERMERFINENPEFEVMYEDAETDNTINEDYHYMAKEYRLYEGSDSIVVIFDDNSRFEFEVHYHNCRGDDKLKYRAKAASKWKSIASKIHNNIELNDVGNPHQYSWKESFSLALKDPALQEYIRQKHHHRVFDI